MSTLQNQLALTEREETARAVRSLLRSPTLRQERAPEEYELVRRRRVAVTEWFDRTLGWSLDLQPRSGVVRLVKLAPTALFDGDARPARRPRSGAPFDRLRYVLLCVVAAELTTRRMVALGELADAVVHACAVDEELPSFETSRHQHRKAFVDVLLLLEELGALAAVDGRTETFADDAATAVLYRVDTVGIFGLTSSPVGSSQVTAAGPDWFAQVLDGLRAEPDFEVPRLLDDVDPDGPDDPRVLRRRRHQVMRALFDDPVVYRDRLPDDQRAYLESISGRRLMRQAAQAAGFVLEERAEGWLLVDPERWSSDEVFPADGASSVAALRILAVLTERESAEVPVTSLHEAVAVLLADNRGWARTYQDDDGPARLLGEAVDLLRRHHLVERRAEALRALPAAQRYRAATLERAPRTARHADPALPGFENGELFGFAGLDDDLDGGQTL